MLIDNNSFKFKIFISLILVLCLVTSVFSSSDYEILIPKNGVIQNIKINSYYYIYYFYHSIFIKCKLLERFDTKSKIKIMKTVFMNLSDRYLKVIIKNYEGTDSLIFTFIITTRKGKKTLYVSSNYNLNSNYNKGTKKLLQGENNRRGYKVTYYIYGDKLVPSSKKFSKYREKYYMDDRNSGRLAFLYLFDELSENDNNIEDLLLESIKNYKGTLVDFEPYLHLSEYYLFKNNPKKSQVMIDKVKSFQKIKIRNKNIITILNDFINREIIYKNEMIKIYTGFEDFLPEDNDDNIRIYNAPDNKPSKSSRTSRRSGRPKPKSSKSRRSRIAEFNKKRQMIKNGKNYKYSIDHLVEASMEGNISEVKEIFKKNKDIDINKNDYFGRLALNPASYFARIKVVEFLIKKGADVNTKDKYGYTPLLQAVRRKNIEIIQILLENGADPDIANNKGNTARGIAEKMGRKDILELLKK